MYVNYHQCLGMSEPVFDKETIETFKNLKWWQWALTIMALSVIGLFLWWTRDSFLWEILDFFMKGEAY